MLWILQNYVVTLLRDKGGANAVEYALIMALVAVFIIAGVLAMSGAIGTLFNSMATCLGDAPACITGLVSPISASPADGQGPFGLGTGTSPREADAD